jgi:hypothetical protein
MKNPCKKAWVHGLALLLTMLAAKSAWGQSPVAASPPLWKVDPLGLGTTLAPPCAPYEDNNGPLLIGNALLDSAPATPGWVAALDLGIVVPHVENRLFADVTRTSGTTAFVHLPTAELGVHAMPKFELGYRWGQATGEVIFSYRFLGAFATQQFSPTDLPAFAPTGAPVRSRLDLEVWDLDYASHEPLTVFDVDMKWRVGLRSLVFFSDSEAANDTLFQKIADHYWSFGPHAMVDFRHALGRTGLDLFGRLDWSIVFGRLTQQYAETVTVGGIVDSGQTNVLLDSQVTTVGFQAGVSWTPPRYQRFHLTAGYVGEFFFYLGTTATPDTSPTMNLTIQGGFLRAEWNY